MIQSTNCKPGCKTFHKIAAGYFCNGTAGKSASGYLGLITVVCHTTIKKKYIFLQSDIIMDQTILFF
ncbi:MAG: hypothetical protein COW66_14115 [Flavobacteriaceae bacterium CG18_big_fil_WC_8_21_14_2_50_34_36]|nr:MAG: hypothetical protein COW66_14115 [Flavobacteriaceae bacterium CG18_big_fil_WC_8_21_14_2_50_34_36]PIZ07002.1 MAG: hypothetical protein COY56_11195 [Flavobacteriaceae bacterium CG_4_10_14_0_8_um_filter_34_31]PJC06255.1 MAG: hypothetical protein CO068_12070 [Flavobacteriaceae bacterium CG_4_9_14_0_8_um_filter_34_30]